MCHIKYIAVKCDKRTDTYSEENSADNVMFVEHVEVLSPRLADRTALKLCVIVVYLETITRIVVDEDSDVVSLCVVEKLR